MSEIEEIQEIVAETKKPGKFNIVDVLKDRAYPTVDVTVYLDEEAAYLASEMDVKVKAAISELETLGENSELEEKLDKLQEQRDVLLSRLSESAYVFTVTGIPEGKRDDIIKECDSKYPPKYTEEKNPFTGEVTKTEVENSERSDYIVDLIWQAHIKKITAPDGDVQDSVTLQDVTEIRRALPIASSGAISNSIEKIRTATALFMLTVDEDFLAKS